MKNIVSIIIPNYNKAKYLSETIYSVLNQSYQNWELIIVDDGSLDNSIELINSFVEKDDRIKLFQRNRLPKGGSTCRNIGIENANGKYILFLDSDDLLISTTIENRIIIIQSDERLDFVVSSMGTFYEKIGDSESTWIPSKNIHLKKILAHELPWSIMQPIWRKGFLQKINGFDEDFPRLQDVEMHTRALMVQGVNYKIISDRKPDCFYRIDNNRIVDNYFDFINKWVTGSLLYVEKMYVEIKKLNVDVSARKSALKGTVVTMVNHILYNSEINNISKKQGKEFISRILNNEMVIQLGSNRLLRWYIKLYRIGMYKIKGFNYISKKIIISSP